MSTLYKRHDVTAVAEVNALALTDNQDNGAFVLGPYGEACVWTLPYAIRNEPTATGHWSYEDGYGGDHLRDGDKATVLVPIEAVAADIWQTGYNFGSSDEITRTLGIITDNERTPNPYRNEKP